MFKKKLTILICKNLYSDLILLKMRFKKVTNNSNKNIIKKCKLV